MTRKRKFWFGGIVTVLLLALALIAISNHSDDKDSVGLPGTESENALLASGDPAGIESGNASAEMGFEGISGDEEESKPLDPKIQRLRDLLDHDANRDQTLALAYVLANGTEAQQLAAIDAFRWLGGREAKKVLIRLRKEAYPAIAAEAGRVLTHLLTEGMYTGSGNSLWVNPAEKAEVPTDEASGEETEQVPSTEVPNYAELVDFDAAIWEQAILEAPAVSDREELLILMSAFPGTKSVPVLLNLLESDDAQIREHALDYLEFVTYGEKITTRQEGEDWLARNGAMEELVP